MKRDELIRAAKEADLWLTSKERIAAVERFATLVAAHEREECAKACELRSLDIMAGIDRSPANHPDRHAAGFMAGAWQEAVFCAGAIRARGLVESQQSNNERG